MAHAQLQTPQVRALRSAIKAGMRAWHEGACAIPRKAVYLPLGLDDSTYSRYLNPEELDIPGILLLGQMVNLTHDPAPFRALLALLGEGYEVGVAADEPAANRKPGIMLADTALVDGEFLAELSRKVAGGGLNTQEAQALLPAARGHLLNAQRDLDEIERIALGRKAV